MFVLCSPAASTATSLPHVSRSAVQCSALCHQHCRCTATATATSLHALALPLLSDSLAHWTAARSTRRSKRRPSFGCSRRSSRSTSHSPARSPTSRATSPPKWYGPVTGLIRALVNRAPCACCGGPADRVANLYGIGRVLTCDSVFRQEYCLRFAAVRLSHRATDCAAHTVIHRLRCSAADRSSAAARSLGGRIHQRGRVRCSMLVRLALRCVSDLRAGRA